MTNRLIWPLGPLLLLCGWILWTYGPGWLNPRPGSIGTSLNNHQAVPVVRELRINDFGLASLRKSNLNDVGGIPYRNRWNNDLHIEVTWIELFTQQAWHVTHVVPVERLSAYDIGMVALRMDIGAGGDFLVWTDRQDFLDMLGAKRSSEITDAMRRPDVIAELCATRLADDDPRRLALFAGMDKWAVRAMEHQHRNWMTYEHLRPADAPLIPTSRCTADWTLGHDE